MTMITTEQRHPRRIGRRFGSFAVGLLVALGLTVASQSTAGAVNGYEQFGMFGSLGTPGSICVGGGPGGFVTMPMTCRVDNHQYALEVDVHLPNSLANGMWFKATVFYRDITFASSPPWVSWGTVPQTLLKVTDLNHYVVSSWIDTQAFRGSVWTGLPDHRDEMVVAFAYAAPGGTWSAAHYVASNTTQYDYRGVVLSRSSKTCFT